MIAQPLREHLTAARERIARPPGRQQHLGQVHRQRRVAGIARERPSRAVTTPSSTGMPGRYPTALAVRPAQRRSLETSRAVGLSASTTSLAARGSPRPAYTSGYLGRLMDG
jgi:hypothetical protein